MARRSHFCRFSDFAATRSDAVVARLAVVLGLVSIAGCSSSAIAPTDSPFESTPLTTVTCNAGALKLAVWTSPTQPPSRGVLTLKLLATDATSGTPLDGLTLDMVPEMPSMGHGTPTVPKINAEGDGVYIAADVDLFMAGRWELRVTITGSASDLCVVPIDAR